MITLYIGILTAISTIITMYIYLPRIYFWLSYDGNIVRLNIKNTSKIGTTIKILNWEELKTTIDSLHTFTKSPGYDEYITEFEGEINIPPEETISRSLGIKYLDKMPDDFNEFQINYDYKIFGLYLFKIIFPMKTKKKSIYFHNLRRLE